MECNETKLKIKHVTVIGKLVDRGRKMPDLGFMVKSMTVVWIQKLFDDSDKVWKQVLKVTTVVNEIMLPIFQTKPNHLPNMLSEFYKQIFDY